MTKSVILAPFNTTVNSINYEVSKVSIGSGWLLIEEKVKEVDRQYHLNNNGELDNGVYNKFIASAQEEVNFETPFLNSSDMLNESWLSYIFPD